MVGEVEARRAARVLALLQRRRVPLVHTLQGAATHPPVEVIHALPLQDDQENSSETHDRRGEGRFLQIKDTKHKKNTYLGEKMTDIKAWVR